MNRKFQVSLLLLVFLTASVSHADNPPTTSVNHMPAAVNFVPPPSGQIAAQSVIFVPWKYDGGILQCTKTGSICTILNMPLLAQGDPGVDPDVKEMIGSGCYDTSILTVILTAVANRDPGFTPTKRTKELLDIAVPARGMSSPKLIKQLSQEYRWAQAGQHGQKVGGKVVQPLYLHEVLADTGGTIVENCDPFTYGSCAEASNAAGHAFRTFVSDNHVTNSYVIGLMKKNYVPLIAFMRYNPAAANGKVTFTPTIGHKVVFSGYRLNSNFPLRINDVGNGQRYWVRLSGDLSQYAFSKAGNVPVYPTATKMFLEYEGSGKDQVFFIEHIDALKLKTKADVAAMN